MNDELFDEKVAVLNHDAGCSLFYSGGCTCDLQARRAKVEAKIEKHDAAHNAARIDEIAAWWAEWRKRTPPAENPTPDALILLDEIKRLRGALYTVMGACDAECSCAASVVAKRALYDVKEKP